VVNQLEIKTRFLLSYSTTLTSLEIDRQQCDFSCEETLRHSKTLKIEDLANIAKLRAIYLALSQEIVQIVKKEHRDKVM